MTKERNTTDREGDLGRPVGYAMRSGAPGDSISNPAENVNNNFRKSSFSGQSETDAAYMELAKKPVENAGALRDLRDTVKNDKVAKAERRFRRALDAQTKTKTATEEGGGTKYSIAIDENKEKYVIINSDEIDTSDGKSIAKNIAKLISEKFGNKIIENGQIFRVNKTTNNEYRESRYSKSLRNKKPQWYSDKLKSIANADEILKTAKLWINEDLKHERNDGIVSFARGKVSYQVGNNRYHADVICGLKGDGSALLYDIVNIYPKKSGRT